MGIAQTAKIDGNCKIAPDAYIGEYSIIEEDVTIGKNSIIESGVYIRSGTAIGKGCIIKGGAVIGGDGFGFCKAPDGTWEKFPHLGKVFIEDNVEIGSNTVINRSVLENTVVGKGTKIDSLVYIAHNVKIGANNIITANVTLAGGVSTGDNVWIGPSSSVLEGCHIGENAYIGMGTVVIRSVEVSTKVVGVPARIIGKTVLQFLYKVGRHIVEDPASSYRSWRKFLGIGPRRKKDWFRFNSACQKKLMA